MNNYALFLLLLSSLLVFLATHTHAESLKCVQCINCILDLPEAAECHLGKKTRDDDYPTCMKIVTKYSDREVVTRQCSPAPRHTEPICSEVKGFEQCIYHCHTDGCNGARGSTSGGKMASWFALLLCLALRFIHI